MLVYLFIMVKTKWLQEIIDLPNNILESIYLVLGYHTRHTVLYSSKYQKVFKILLINIPYYRCNVQPVRNLTKFSLKKGKRKTVKTVVDRFFRLGW